MRNDKWTYFFFTKVAILLYGEQYSSFGQFILGKNYYRGFL